MQSRRITYFNRLSKSFQAVYRCLERPQIARRTVFVLLVIHSGLLAYSAYVHSPTLNEPGHLVAGLSHWKFGRFELYRVNPPLVRMVAALPVMAVGYEEDWSGFYEGPGARPVFPMGEDFVAANGERSFFLFMIARWACIPFSWIGAITCYLWARDLYGRPAGVMACVLWCFEPNTLAHASLITADVGGTALGVAACYTFWKWLKNPTWMQALLTGVVLGLAELCKTTLILFYPLWPVLWLIYRWPDHTAMQVRDWFREAGMLALRMAIGLYILNVGYGFEDTCKPLGEFHFVSDLFTGRESSNATQEAGNESTSVSKPPFQNSHNRYAAMPLGNIPVPFPKNYLLGIDIQQRDFENYVRPSYLRGKWQDYGWWYYYLYAAAIKVPLGTWLLSLIVAAAILASRRKNPRRGTIAFRDGFVLLMPPLVIFVVCSAKTGFSEHFRYVLPCFPFVFIGIACFSPTYLHLFKKNTVDSSGQMAVASNSGVCHTSRFFGSYAASILLLWSFASSLWIYPHSLSYFNEVVGGPLNGAEHLLGSSVDSGQDLRYLKRWLDGHPESKPPYLVYCGYFDPTDVGLSVANNTGPPLCVDSASSYVKGVNIGRRAVLGDDSYAVSVSFVKGASLVGSGNSLWNTSIGKSFIGLLRYYPTQVRCGYSICIYSAIEQDE